MKILAVDSTATTASVAICEDDRLLAEYTVSNGNTHSETLLPMVESALRTLGLSVSDIELFACSAGPGSFTGVRIGVSAVKGLAFAENKPCISVSTLESMAEAFRGLPMEAILCCAMDARCNQVYAALFQMTANGDIARLSEDEAISLEDLRGRLESLKAPIVFVGDGANICYRYYKDTLFNVSLAPLSVRYQTAENVAVTAMRMFHAGLTISSDELLPSYLRLPQAERELRSRLGNV
jgi:tRNA threonylcarbamoyladenosine biosynthesis protein TsaB